MTDTVSDIVGAKIKQLRTERGWSVRRLVDECKAIGFDVTSSVIENIEGTKRTNSQPDRRRRAIAVDELVAIAYVLEVSPLVLLLPRENVLYQLTPEETASARLVYEWMVGELLPPFPFPEEGITDEDRVRARYVFSRLLSYVSEPSVHGQKMQENLDKTIEEAVTRKVEEFKQQTGQTLFGVALIASGVKEGLLTAAEAEKLDPDSIWPTIRDRAIGLLPPVEKRGDDDG